MLFAQICLGVVMVLSALWLAFLFSIGQGILIFWGGAAAFSVFTLAAGFFGVIAGIKRHAEKSRQARLEIYKLLKAQGEAELKIVEQEKVSA